jgi:hypothetical protein
MKLTRRVGRHCSLAPSSRIGKRITTTLSLKSKELEMRRLKNRTNGLEPRPIQRDLAALAGVGSNEQLGMSKIFTGNAGGT